MINYLFLGPGFIIAVYVITFLLGITIGSFLNVCIFRIPLKQEIAIERSHCMSCGHYLKWYELIPLFSWMIQGGKCRACKAKISKQYPIVEATNGLLWLLVLTIWGVRLETILFCICTSLLIVISVIDERTQEIPIQLNIGIAILGVLRIVVDVIFRQGQWLEFVIGFFTVSTLFFLIVLITKGRGMGMGDVKLMAAAGLLLGWKHILLAMMLGCILGSVIHIIRMNVDKKKEHVLAFGPYLSMGIYLTILFGNPILEWYLGFFKH